MNNLTLAETIFIIYLLVIVVLGLIALIMSYRASKKVSDIVFYIWFVIAIPITFPVTLFVSTFDKWNRRKRKQDLEKQLDENIKGDRK